MHSFDVDPTYEWFSQKLAHMQAGIGHFSVCSSKEFGCEPSVDVHTRKAGIHQPTRCSSSVALSLYYESFQTQRGTSFVHYASTAIKQVCLYTVYRLPSQWLHGGEWAWLSMGLSVCEAFLGLYKVSVSLAQVRCIQFPGNGSRMLRIRAGHNYQEY